MGGSPGTPGVNTSPLAMPIRSDASILFRVVTEIRRDAVSPGFRRGLLLGREDLPREEALGGSPGTP